jgi:hypothetical protein
MNESVKLKICSMCYTIQLHHNYHTITTITTIKTTKEIFFDLVSLFPFLIYRKLIQIQSSIVGNCPTIALPTRHFVQQFSVFSKHDELTVYLFNDWVILAKTDPKKEKPVIKYKYIFSLSLSSIHKTPIDKFQRTLQETNEMRSFSCLCWVCLE